MDYDIGVVGLASPPAQAVVTSYRPAVSVRNNGIHDAIASGYLRIYAAGLLVFETEVYSGTLSPGSTGTADAIDYWTPPSEGTYVIQGYVSTPLDQVEPNNNLNPITIIVAGGPVPPTPTVPLHAAQHEEGGTDPVNVDGLPGVLKDRQLPSSHAAQHQAGGGDAINIGGLAGVAGDAQTPIVHGNAHHTPDMATSDELEAHSGSVAAHTAATNLANRETTGPLTGRVPQDQIQLGTAIPEDPEDDPDAMGLRFDRNMGYVNPAHHAYKHALGGTDPITGPLQLAEAYLQVIRPIEDAIVALGLLDRAETFTMLVWNSIDHRIGIGNTTPTALLHLSPRNHSPGNAVLKLGSQPLLVVPEPGAIEFDGVDFYFTDDAGNRGKMTHT